MGLFDFLSSKKDSGRDAGNPFNLSAEDASKTQGELAKFLNYQSDPNVTGTGASDFATNQVQNNSVLGQLFGKGGTLDRTNQEEQDLSKNGWSLKPEDMQAYGQASDNLAREFGSSGGSLAQALSDRGISNSGAAGAAFSGLQGNKLEQLGQVQRQIANDRMNTNMQRLGQTRQFLSGLSGQASNDINQQYGRNMSGEQEKFNQAQGKNNAAYQRLNGLSDQSNANLMQRQQTQQQQGWASALQGLGNDAETIGMSYAINPASFGNKAKDSTQSAPMGNAAGGSYKNTGVIS